MIVNEIHDLNNQRVTTLLKQGLSHVDKESYVSNYHPDYESIPGNLFNTLKSGRYKLGQGKYYIIEEDGNYIASAGWNEYDLDNNIALMLTRLYIVPEHRAKYHAGNYILPRALEEVKRYIISYIAFLFLFCYCLEYRFTFFKSMRNIPHQSI